MNGGVRRRDGRHVRPRDGRALPTLLGAGCRDHGELRRRRRLPPAHHAHAGLPVEGPPPAIRELQIQHAVGARLLPADLERLARLQHGGVSRPVDHRHRSKQQRLTVAGIKDPKAVYSLARGFRGDVAHARPLLLLIQLLYSRNDPRPIAFKLPALMQGQRKGHRRRLHQRWNTPLVDESLRFGGSFGQRGGKVRWDVAVLDEILRAHHVGVQEQVAYLVVPGHGGALRGHLMPPLPQQDGLGEFDGNVRALDGVQGASAKALVPLRKQHLFDDLHGAGLQGPGRVDVPRGGDTTAEGHVEGDRAVDTGHQDHPPIAHRNTEEWPLVGRRLRLQLTRTPLKPARALLSVSGLQGSSCGYFCLIHGGDPRQHQTSLQADLQLVRRRGLATLRMHGRQEHRHWRRHLGPVEMGLALRNDYDNGVDQVSWKQAGVLDDALQAREDPPLGVWVRAGKPMQLLSDVAILASLESFGAGHDRHNLADVARCE
mmetsp:Transcript_74679/g.216701  ORF Transcript_74679/g.216701 Transcript_74679/m.216701 type:complete len:486 (-) Transcript_74679:410-1867(-)